MTDRIRLLRVEVEGRGSSWLEFRSQEEVAEALARDGGSDGERLVNGTGTGMGEGEERSSAWADGTFQTGRIVNGEIRMDGNTGAEVVGNGTATANGTANVNGTGGRLDDEALSRAMEERMRGLEEDDEEGMHL